jgi:hypothetical protein
MAKLCPEVKEGLKAEKRIKMWIKTCCNQSYAANKTIKADELKENAWTSCHHSVEFMLKPMNNAKHIIRNEKVWEHALLDNFMFCV